MAGIERALRRKVERDGQIRINDYYSITLPRQIAVDYRALVKAYREHEQRVAERDQTIARLREALYCITNTPPMDLTSAVKRSEDWWYRLVDDMTRQANAALAEGGHDGPS